LLTVSAKSSSASASGAVRAVESPSPIAGVVLPIARAEELLATLPGVINVRIIAADDGEVEEVHVLTTSVVSPKQTVRNVESALLAQLGMRVSHKKISVATSEGTAADALRAGRVAQNAGPVAVPDGPPAPRSQKRKLYFEDVEVRRSRQSGITCRVTIRRDEGTFIGEATAQESDRHRIETAARAALDAVTRADTEGRTLAFEGARLIEAFEREFVFVALAARVGREAILLTGSAQVRDSVETASALAVLDATNRWVD
jgi:hypothetical protein